VDLETRRDLSMNFCLCSSSNAGVEEHRMTGGRFEATLVLKQDDNQNEGARRVLLVWR
jgi:hypothetical protein